MGGHAFGETAARLTPAEVERPQRGQRTAHCLPPAPADAAAAQQCTQGQQSELAGVREEGLNPFPHHARALFTAQPPLDSPGKQ